MKKKRIDAVRSSRVGSHRVCHVVSKGLKKVEPSDHGEVDDAIRKLSYCVGTLKDYRSIRIQLEKEKEEEE